MVSVPHDSIHRDVEKEEEGKYPPAHCGGRRDSDAERCGDEEAEDEFLEPAVLGDAVGDLAVEDETLNVVEPFVVDEGMIEVDAHTACERSIKFWFIEPKSLAGKEGGQEVRGDEHRHNGRRMG